MAVDSSRVSDVPAAAAARVPEPAGPARGPVMVSSWNGGPALDTAARELAAGRSPLEALVAGIQVVEDDPEELSVGYGGLPNEDGEVELDAAVMDGPAHRAGAVAGVRRVRHVARLALEVLRRTDHALLVGEGARKFARALGFPEEELLTDKSRGAWLDWKARLSPRDAWVSADETASDFGAARWAGHTDPAQNQAVPPRDARTPAPGDSRSAPDVPFTYGTIHASLLTAPGGDLYGCTSTSGLSYKIAGRVGDSAVVGAGIYTDNEVGSAGATGRGEAVLQVCGGYAVVRAMEMGRTPEEACLDTLKRIADKTRLTRLRDAQGKPNFNVTLYAVRKDGLAGAASLLPGYEFVVHRQGMTKVCKARALLE